MTPVYLYHTALDKILTAPLALTEKDFDVLNEFNPADEVRARAARKRAQLAVTPDVPLETKSAPPVVAEPPRPRLNPEFLARAIGTTLVEVLGPLRDRVKVLESSTMQTATAIATAATAVAEAHTRLDGLTAQLAAAEQENALLRKAIGIPDPPRDRPARVN